MSEGRIGSKGTAYAAVNWRQLRPLLMERGQTRHVARIDRTLDRLDAWLARAEDAAAKHRKVSLLFCVLASVTVAWRLRGAYRRAEKQVGSMRKQHGNDPTQ